MKNYYIIILSLFIGISGVVGQNADSTKTEKKKEQVKTKSTEQQQKKTGEQKQKQAQEREQVQKDQQNPEGQQQGVEPAGTEQPLEGFVDANGNGIDDHLEQGGKGYRKGKNPPRDRFIDTDGDGICDGKESAIGLRKLYRKHKGNPGNK